MKKTSFLFCLILVVSSLKSQNVCGTVSDEAFLDKVDEYKKMIRDGLVSPRAETVYIPLNFHLVANTAGSGRLRIDKMLDQLHGLNADYTIIDFHFYLDNDEDGLFNTIDNDLVFSEPRNNSAQFLMNSVRDLDALNIFTVQSSGVDNVLGTYFGGFDWIVDLNSVTNEFSGVLTHELGHFFGLPHTQEGFDATDDVWGDNPDELNIQAPSISPQGDLTELADSSNCEQAADRICDTPADYGVVQSGCNPWIRTDILDPDSMAITPLINNHMSWIINGCGPVFTSGQMDVVSANYATNARNYLRPSVPPTLDSVTEIQSLIFPADDEMVPNGTVTLTWDEVPNAQFYLVNLAERVTFTNGFREYLVETNEITLDDLNDDDKYYWNVRPFNTYFADPDVISETRIFETGLIVAVNDIDGIEQFSIRPNPIGKNETISIRLSNQSPITQAKLELRDVTGKIIVEKELGHINSGTTSIQLDTPELASGYYVVTLNSEQGIRSEKVLAL